MSYHPRIESREFASLLTTRSRNSELWFVNNHALEQRILSYAAKYAKRYEVKLYALAIEGNHIQSPAHFPQANRAQFMRDFNSSVARAVDRLTPEYPGGRFWGRRYSNEFLPEAKDIEEYFFYTVLQPVQDGLVEKISDYPGYNCFHDAIYGIERKFKVVRWGEYNSVRRTNPTISIKLFTEEVSLKYERIPGYEGLSQKEYAQLMLEKLEEYRKKIIDKRAEEGIGFLGRDRILQRKRGALPVNTKKSELNTHRPRVLSVCAQRRAKGLAWYFSVYKEYKHASRLYLLGNFDVKFPEGTYRPYFNIPVPCG